MKKVLVTLSVFTLALTGCASITQGTNQVISFSIDPTEAKCSIVGSDGATKGSVTGRSNLFQVSKRKNDLIVNCQAEGYEQKTTRIVSSTQAAGVIGVVIDFGIVDMLTGAMWKYPDHVSIAMDKTAKKQ